MLFFHSAALARITIIEICFQPQMVFVVLYPEFVHDNVLSPVIPLPHCWHAS